MRTFCLFSSAALVFTLLAGGCGDSEDSPGKIGRSSAALLGSRIWSYRYGDQENQYGRSIAVDSAGNVALTGEFRGTIDFGCGPLSTPAESTAAFVAKFSPSGVCQWSLTLGRNGASQYGRGVAIDAYGDILLVGDFWASISFPGAGPGCGILSSAGGAQIFLAKLGATSGSCLWASRFGDSANQFGRSVTVDSGANVIIAGEFFSTVDFGGGPLVSQGDSDLYVAKFDRYGAYQWSSRYGDAAEQVATSVAVDPSNDVTVTGLWGPDIFLAKLSSTSGVNQWSQIFGGIGIKFGSNVRADQAGNLVVTGAFNSVIDFRAPVYCPVLQGASGTNHIFLAKFNAAGECVWAQRFGDAQEQQGTAVAIGPSGSIFLTGHYSGTAVFDGVALPYRTRPGIFLAKFGANGNHYGGASYGGTQDQNGEAVAVDQAGSVILSGYFAGDVDFGGQPLSSAGIGASTFDAFLVKFAYACDGSTCEGCCDGSTCRAISVTSCGIGGRACVRCDSGAADRCGPSGLCQCGIDQPCEAGQRCDGGRCVCDSVSCPTGCCNGATCTPSSFTSCGTGGTRCVRCEVSSADRCTSGRCQCGAQECAAGQYCDAAAGVCRCSPGSCPNGCCDGTRCRHEVAACGTGGGACINCATSVTDTCGADGRCQCGSQPPCGAGLRCAGGRCVCDTQSGCAGCCTADGSVCRSGTEPSACGSAGGPCTPCNPDSVCSTGACRCPECGTPGSCRQCTCAGEYGPGSCGMYPICHSCTCEELSLCGGPYPACTPCPEQCPPSCCPGSCGPPPGTCFAWCRGGARTEADPNLPLEH